MKETRLFLESLPPRPGLEPGIASSVDHRLTF